MESIKRFCLVNSCFNRLTETLAERNTTRSLSDLAKEAADYSTQDWRLPWPLNYFYERKLKNFYEKMTQRLEIICPDHFEKWVILKKLGDIANWSAIWAKAIQPKMDQLHNEVVQQENCNGFTYKITNPSDPNGTQHYLIGTLHMATVQMAENRKILERVDHCDELISEIGDHPLWRNYIFYKDNKTDPFRFCVDASLTLRGLNQKKTLKALETLKDRKIQNQRILAQNFRNFEKRKIQTKPLNKTETNFTFLLTERSWQMGNSYLESLTIQDEVFIKKVKSKIDTKRLNKNFQLSTQEEMDLVEASQLEILGEERNKTWLYDKGLIDTMYKTKPTCIFVGAMHLFGQDGLIEGFERAGLKVERLSAQST